MNKKKFLQAVGSWAWLLYPKAPWYIRNCGCGEVAITHLLIELKKYEKYTPSTIQPYAKRYAEAHGNGTYHAGIPAMMKHYGFKEVAEHPTMASLWKELRKEKRGAVLLMGSAAAGTKGVRWTSSGHYVVVVDYKEKNGKHYLYIKDSASNSLSRNGWVTYEGNVRGACLKCWSGAFNGTLTGDTGEAVTDDGKLAADGVGGAATVKATQAYFGTTEDGVVSGQDKKMAKYFPALTAVEFGKSGSDVVRKIQKWVGTVQDGFIGQGTVAAFQQKLKDAKYYTGVIDGVWGAKTMEAWQTYLNDHAGEKPTYPVKEVTAEDADKAWAAKIKKKMHAWMKAAIGVFKYVNWSGNPKTHECPICHHHSKTGKLYGGNCIWGIAAALYHGAGIKAVKCACNGLAGGSGVYTKILKKAKKSKKDALEYWTKKVGFGKWEIIYNGGKDIPLKQLQQDDILIYYAGDTFWHIAALYDKAKGRIWNCSSTIGGTGLKDYDLPYPCKIAFRLIGK